ncbi:E3 ubiquitin-protein ligase AMFR, partial [Lamellibrachia satsuma]
MPVVSLERLPLPSLRTYVSVSVLLTSCAIYYAHHVTQHVALAGVHDTIPTHSNSAADSPSYAEGEARTRQTWAKTSDGYFYDMIAVLIGEGWCVWSLINMAYCCLILIGKLIQRITFGKLRVSEQQHVKDKFLNFMFYKFIFIFGVMNVQNMDEVLLWCTWFSVLCLLHLLTQLCKDRFEYLSFSPTIPLSLHVKVLVLLAVIQASCAFLLLLSVFVGYVYAGINIFAFMAAEVQQKLKMTVSMFSRYAIHLWDMNHEGVWENRAIYVYYAELIFELATLSIDFCHHLHMLLWGHIFLSMASLVICMQLRYLFHDFQRRVRRHKNYLRVVSSMEARFAMATKEELDENNDDCAICWEGMETARKLPCGHLFHSACLRSWLEQDTSCPTCRMNLSDPSERTTRAPATGDINGNEPRPDAQNNDLQNQMTNHFFHFDGSRYVSWLPSFSVEVTHTQILGNGMDLTLNPIHTSQLDNMARQVQEVFPTVPLTSVVDDLRMTHSVELTIENIIEGRVTIPP